MTLRDAISQLPRLLAVAVGLSLLYAGYREGVSAFALHLAATRLPEELQAAASLTPDNADIWRERARAAADSDPATAATLFEHALLLNPADAGSRMALGLLAESAGQLAIAERHLRAACAVSRRAKPQLTLAYFYARHGPVEEFWRAANRAAAVEGAELQPLFAVAHAIVPDPAQVAAALQLSSQSAIAAYTRFLLGHPDASPLAATALRLDTRPAHRDLILAATGRLLRDGSSGGAVRLWNRLYPGSLDPATGRSIVNPDFAPGDGAGFDWRHAPVFGVSLRRAAGDLRVEFTGRQPESVVLIEQDIPVLPRRVYRLSWSGSQTGNPIRPGLVWTLGHSRRAPIPALPDAGGSMTFETTRGENLLRLGLQYQRPPGTTRLDGALNLQSVELTLR